MHAQNRNVNEEASKYFFPFVLLRKGKKRKFRVFNELQQRKNIFFLLLKK